MAQRGLITLRSNNPDADAARTFDPHQPITLVLSGPSGEKMTFSSLRCRYYTGVFDSKTIRQNGPTDSVTIPADTFPEAEDNLRIELWGWLVGDEYTRSWDWVADNKTGGNRITAAGLPPSFTLEQEYDLYTNPYSGITAAWCAKYDWNAIRESARFLRMDVEISPQGRETERQVITEHNRVFHANYGMDVRAWWAMPPGKYVGCDYVNVRVNFIFADGAQTGWSRWARFNTKDSVGVATPTQPVNQYVDGSKPVTFSWAWSNQTGSSPTKAELAISTTSTDYQTIATVQGHLPFVAAQGSLPSGNLFWRVRGYNVDSVPSAWSDGANIVVRQAPAAPTIVGATTLPRPIVTWQAAEQQGYQLVVGSWDSGTVYGADKQAQTPATLPDGRATVALRVQNILGLWSAWATQDIFIANKPAEAVTLRTSTTLAGITLQWSTDGLYSKYQILRDGAVAGTTTDKAYTDYLCSGKHRYMVRGVKLDSSYTDSSAVTEIAQLVSGAIAVYGVWDWLILNRRIGGRPTRGGSHQPDFALVWYSGRPLPVAETTPHISRSYDVAYTLPDLATVRKLEAMSGKRVVYKHRDGDIAVGIMGGISYVSNMGRWDVSVQITEVDDGTVF